MNHDLMCDYGLGRGAACQCDLIARIVERERAVALREARRAVIHSLGPMSPTSPDQLATAIAAIEALGGER